MKDKRDELKILTWFNKLIWSDYLIISYLPIAIFILWFNPNFFDKSTYSKNKFIPILIKVDSLSVPKYSPLEHNSSLINTLQQRFQNQQDGIQSFQEIQNESRNFYSLILIGILSILFGNIDNIKLKKQLFILGLIFIFIMYFVDVNSKDMIGRAKYIHDIHNKTINSLVNSYPIDISWYKLDYTKLNIEMEKVKEHSERWIRKIKSFYQPDLLQGVFYLLPFLVIYCSGRYFLQRRSVKTLESNSVN